MIRKTVHFSGMVQGVGFRFTAQALARDFSVTGFVQNLPDGRVRLVAEGEPAEIDKFLDSIRDQMGAYIRNIDSETTQATGEFDGFQVRR